MYWPDSRETQSDEYYALWQLLIIVPTYYCLFVGLGWIVMGVYAASVPDALDLIDKNNNHPAWYSHHCDCLLKKPGRSLKYRRPAP